MSKAFCAVAGAHFSPRGGLVPLLLIAAVWGVFTVYLPGASLIGSIWFVAAVGVVMGIGMRIHLSSNRAYLLPGLREANRVVAMSVISLALLVVIATGASRLPPFQSVAVLWLCALGCLYVVGLSRSVLSMLSLTAILGGLLGILGAMLPTSLREHFVQEFSGFDARWVAALLLADVFLTIHTWRRIGNLRGLSFVLPGTQESTAWSEFRDRASLSNSLESMAPRVPPGFWQRVRHFRFSTRIGASNIGFLFGLWMTAAFWFRLLSILNPSAFAFHIALPSLVVGVNLSISPITFTLPLRRTDIVKCWGTALFISVLKCWAAVALPYNILILTLGPAGAASSIPLAIAASLAAQLPLFGVTMLAANLKTAHGFRYTVFLLPMWLLIAAAVVLAGTQPTAIVAIFMGSILIGPILIWLAYRRWLTAEVS